MQKNLMNIEMTNSVELEDRELGIISTHIAQHSFSGLCKHRTHSIARQDIGSHSLQKKGIILKRTALDQNGRKARRTDLQGSISSIILQVINS